jgi:hypothetical protein
MVCPVEGFDVVRVCVEICTILKRFLSDYVLGYYLD